MTKWSDFDRFLKGEHLGGRRVTATIVEMTIEEVHAGGMAEDKPVLWFEESKKGLIVTPTNRKALQDLFGDDVAGCIGKRVYLEARPMTVANRLTNPIRIVGSPDAPNKHEVPAIRSGAAPHAAPPISEPPAQPLSPAPAAATSADKDFEDLPSQGAALRERVQSASQPPLLDEAPAAGPAPATAPGKRRAATVESSAIRRWQELTEDFANEYPRFRIRGSDQIDRLTLLYIVSDLGHTRVTLDNLDQVLAELRDHERTRAARPQEE